MLVEYFADKHATRSGKSIEALDDGVIAWLQEYHWPGNVRELENTIERAVVLTTGSTITRDAVTVEATAMSVRTAGVPSLKLRQNVEWIERETIRRALEMSTVKQASRQAHGHQPAGAVLLSRQIPIHRPERNARMKFAKIVFIAAGVWGITVLTPLYFLVDVTGRHYAPPTTYPQFFYGFFSVAMAWQIAFLIIGSNPGRFRPLMIHA